MSSFIHVSLRTVRHSLSLRVGSSLIPVFTYAMLLLASWNLAWSINPERACYRCTDGCFGSVQLQLRRCCLVEDDKKIKKKELWQHSMTLMEPPGRDRNQQKPRPLSCDWAVQQFASHCVDGIGTELGERRGWKVSILLLVSQWGAARRVRTSQTIGGTSHSSVPFGRIGFCRGANTHTDWL